MGIVGQDQGLYDPAMAAETVQTPFVMDMLNASPGLTTTTLWNMGRVKNTVVGGGTSGRIARATFGRDYYAGRGTGGMLRGGLTQTLGPRHYRRLTRAANIDPTYYGKGSKIYSPFNVLSSAGNTLFNQTNRIKKLPAIGESLAGQMGRLTGEAPLNRGERMFSPGTLGRMRTFDAVSRMSERSFQAKAFNITGAIKDINPTVHRAFTPKLANYLMSESSNDIGARFAYRSGLGETITGRVSGRVAGYIQGAEAASRGGEALVGARSTLLEGSSFAQGVEKGILGFTEKSTLGRIAGSGAISTGLRYANVAGWAMLAHDVASMGGKLIGKGIDLSIEAAQSVKGDLDKPLMGMGFKDNTVAATSRQRGVMAIQNSRLNMRSYLGSEAASMHAHFG